MSSAGWDKAAARPIPSPGFAGDEGHADPRLDRALAAHATDPARLPDVLAALHVARVLAPVVAVPATPSGDAPGPRSGQAEDSKDAADIAVPLLVGDDGRRALAVFSGLATLARWEPTARPVPVMGTRAAEVAQAEGAEVLVVDVGGPLTCALGETEVRALAEGRGAVPAYDDADLVAALRTCATGVPGVRAAVLAPARGADARLLLDVASGADAGAVVAAVSGAVREDPTARAAAVRGLQVAVLRSGRRPPVGRPVLGRPAPD